MNKTTVSKTTIPELRSVDYLLRPRAQEYWDEGDLNGFLCIVQSHDRFKLVADNYEQLLKRGWLEDAIVQSYTSFNCNMALLPRESIEELIKKCDRKKLLEAGDPLPGSGPFKLYRGVGGWFEEYYIRGMSWTGTPEVAAWFSWFFAEKLESDEPAVYKLIVPKDRVLFYSNQRKEDEYVVDMWPEAQLEELNWVPEPILNGRPYVFLDRDSS